nr:Ty3/gypsy retrotransposon protein [Tanacetum cinerariifolium]
MADDEDDTVQESEEDAVESGDISILNSLIGQGIPRSLQLWGMIGSGTMHVLIDNGSTHNFVRPNVMEKMRLPVQSTKPFKVYIESGETLLCESICSWVMLSMQADEMFDELGGANIFTKLDLRFGSTNFMLRKQMFGATTVEYLGHIIIGKGAKMDLKKATSVMEWPVPTMQQHIRGFLGHVGDMENKAFQDLKARLLEALILGLLHFKDMFIVEADVRMWKLERKEVLDGFRREEGMILFRDRCFIGVESKLKELLLYEFHNTSMAGHSGVKRMLLKQSLAQANNQMVMKANRKRRNVEYKTGDMILVKLQPYRQVTMAKCCSKKLAKRYYGPFEVLERIGRVAYRLALLESSKIHSVFHVSLLKFFLGTGQEGVVTKLSEEEYEGHPVEQPLVIYDLCVVLYQGLPTRQVLVQWTGSSPEETTWEWLYEFQEAYMSYHIEDKVISEGEKNVTPKILRNGRPKRTKSKPSWKKDFVM